eukprot:3186009-Alexandrium_andersonii.AAC.1
MVSLDDAIPDIGDCVACGRPVPDGAGDFFTCGHRMHDECLRAHRDRQGPTAGCPCCGPEYVANARGGPGGDEEDPHRCAVCREDTGAPASAGSTQWP